MANRPFPVCWRRRAAAADLFFFLLLFPYPRPPDSSVEMGTPFFKREYLS